MLLEIPVKHSSSSLMPWRLAYWHPGLVTNLTAFYSLFQVYHILSSPAESRITRERFKEAQRGGKERKKHTATGTDVSHVIDTGGKKTLPNGAEYQETSGNMFSHLVGSENIGCCPPINPFMVPLNLLMRK